MARPSLYHFGLRRGRRKYGLRRDATATAGRGKLLEGVAAPG